MPETELTKLRRTRRRIHAQLRKLEPLLAGYHAKLARIEARIQEIDPRLDLPTRNRRPNPIFVRGELPRIVLDVLRREGKPLPVAVIAARALAGKGVTLPGPGTMRQVRTKVREVLGKLEARGVTASVGRGNATRRGLAGSTFRV